MPAASVLLGGPEAAAALAKLLARQALAGVASYPEAKGREPAAPQLLAVANAHGALLIDVSTCAELLAALWLRPAGPTGRADVVLAAVDAKAQQHALWRGELGQPRRWACLGVNEQLLGAASGTPVDLASVSTRYRVAYDAQSAAGMQALVQRAQAVFGVVCAQGKALTGHGMQAVSKLEAACVVPTAALERNGLAFDGQAFRRQLAAEAHLVKQPATTAAVREQQALIARLQQHHGPDFAAWLRPDGRIHATFLQIGASTGRMACREPNLQGVPKAGERRTCFAAPHGRQLVTADYAACELRILAEMSGDPDYARAFQSGQDVHMAVAERLFGRAASESQAQQRRQAAKMLSFGLIYGMQAPGLAKRLGQTVACAEQWLRDFFRAYPSLSAYLEDTSAASVRQGYVTTLLGRRLTLPQDDHARALRLARNMPIQGSGADLTKGALVRAHAACPRQSKRLLVHAIHDSLMLECDEGDASATTAALTEAMQGAGSALLRSIPTPVDTTCGAHWT